MADLARLHAQYDRAAALLARPGAAVHFVGIAGVGMAGLATLLAERGWRISGCDSHPDAPTVPPLRALGVEVAAGHDPAHLDALDPGRGDFVVRTPAADPASPELAAAAARGLPVLDRGAVLAALLDALPCPLVAVCGTHGKTTTATFTATLLRELGADPGWCIGATPPSLGTGARLPVASVLQETALSATAGGAGVSAPRPSPPLVAECDESDGSLALYHPAVTVLGSVDFDHAEHFASEAEFLGVFEAVLSQTTLAVVYNADDPRLRAFIERRMSPSPLLSSLSPLPSNLSPLPTNLSPLTSKSLLPVGTGPAARLRATNLAPSPSGTSFDLSLDGTPLGRFHLPIPGHHNLLNALAAIGAILSLGAIGDILHSSFSILHSREPLQAALASLRLPDRRFEIISTAGGIRVVADYAHHPAEIAACLAMARATLEPGGRLIAVFQPHRPSRTLALGPQFPAAFAEADALALAPVYAASEPDIPGGDIADLYAHFRFQRPPILLRSLGEALPWLRGIARPGDTVLLVGAGDIISLASAFRPGWNAAPPLPPTMEGAEIEPGASAAPLCSYGVGGPVRALARIRTIEALRALLAWCRDTATPWRVLGAGTNFLVPDTGFDGLLLRLEGPAFAGLSTEGAQGDHSPCPWRVGAALPGARLLAEWQRLGYSGLECMDGIPGTIGGWLAMNAGAQGHAIGDCLVSLDVLDPESGDVRTLPRSALNLGYRSATLSLSSGAATARQKSHAEFAEFAEASGAATARDDSHTDSTDSTDTLGANGTDASGAATARLPNPSVCDTGAAASVGNPCYPCHPCETIAPAAGAAASAVSEARPLSSFIILSAVLTSQEQASPSVVAERREVFRAKRFDFRGLRTAGSVFRNPPGDSAGRLLDAAGLKGMRIGGAFVSERHANIFCAGPDATASDLLALIRLARLRVPSLIPEVCIL